MWNETFFRILFVIRYFACLHFQDAQRCVRLTALSVSCHPTELLPRNGLTYARWELRHLQVRQVHIKYWFTVLIKESIACHGSLVCIFSFDRFVHVSGSSSSVALALGISVVVMLILAAVMYIALRIKNKPRSSYASLSNECTQDDEQTSFNENTTLSSKPHTSYSWCTERFKSIELS